MISGGGEGNGDFCRSFFDLVGIFANWCISQDFAQNCEAATCCLTALLVGRDFAQYGQRETIFADIQNWKKKIFRQTVRTFNDNAAQVCFFNHRTFNNATSLLWLMPHEFQLPTSLLPMQHSFLSTIDVLFTRSTRFIVCGVGVYKWVSLRIFLSSGLRLTTY